MITVFNRARYFVLESILVGYITSKEVGYEVLKSNLEQFRLNNQLELSKVANLEKNLSFEFGIMDKSGSYTTNENGSIVIDPEKINDYYAKHFELFNRGMNLSIVDLEIPKDIVENYPLEIQDIVGLLFA